MMRERATAVLTLRANRMILRAIASISRGDVSWPGGNLSCSVRPHRPAPRRALRNRPAGFRAAGRHRLDWTPGRPHVASERTARSRVRSRGGNHPGSGFRSPLGGVLAPLAPRRARLRPVVRRFIAHGAGAPGAVCTDPRAAHVRSLQRHGRWTLGFLLMFALQAISWSRSSVWTAAQPVSDEGQAFCGQRTFRPTRRRRPALPGDERELPTHRERSAPAEADVHLLLRPDDAIQSSVRWL